jgi:hypothetical protein
VIDCFLKRHLDPTHLAKIQASTKQDTYWFECELQSKESFASWHFGTVELNAKVQVVHRLILVITKRMLQSLKDNSKHEIGRVACEQREWVELMSMNVGR